LQVGADAQDRCGVACSCDLDACPRAGANRDFPDLERDALSVELEIGHGVGIGAETRERLDA
jgi:hypothetical protein